MNKTHKQSSKKTEKSKQLTKKQQQRLTARLEKEFDITGFYITRDNLEGMGYETSDVSDSTMRDLAINLGDLMDWQAEDAIEVADKFHIPKHPEKPTT